MRPEIFRFLKKLIFTTLAIAVLMVIVFYNFLKPYYTPFLPFLLIFVFGFTFLSFSYLVKTAEKDFGRFIRKTMVITVLRLFVYVLITVLYAVYVKHNLASFVISTGVFYLIFTSLEVYELILGTKRPEPDKKKT
jgi:hypothetical protein